MDERKRLGNQGEEAVARWLRREGYQLLASQYRCRFGEIDLIVRSREECLCRFDVAEGYPAPEGEPTINYIANAF